jgi:hypothetical protein
VFSRSQKTYPLCVNCTMHTTIVNYLGYQLRLNPLSALVLHDQHESLAYRIAGMYHHRVLSLALLIFST